MAHWVKLTTGEGAEVAINLDCVREVSINPRTKQGSEITFANGDKLLVKEAGGHIIGGGHAYTGQPGSSGSAGKA